MTMEGRYPVCGPVTSAGAARLGDSRHVIGTWSELVRANSKGSMR